MVPFVPFAESLMGASSRICPCLQPTVLHGHLRRPHLVSVAGLCSRTTRSQFVKAPARLKNSSDVLGHCARRRTGVAQGSSSSAPHQRDDCVSRRVGLLQASILVGYGSILSELTALTLTAIGCHHANYFLSAADFFINSVNSHTFFSGWS